MSVAEGIGLAMVAGLCGVVCGAMAAMVVVLQDRRQTGARHHRVEAYARWLAARLALSRACAAWVASTRALAHERPESAYFDLRKEEARRARNQWYEALHELDLARVSLVILTGDSSLRTQLTRLGGIDGDLIRTAIQADNPKWERLMERLRAADVEAVQFVETAMIDEKHVDRGKETWLTRAVHLGRTVFRNWTKPGS